MGWNSCISLVIVQLPKKLFILKEPKCSSPPPPKNYCHWNLIQATSIQLTASQLISFLYNLLLLWSPPSICSSSPALLVCNDVRESRINRIHAVIKQYLYSMDKWKNRLIVTLRDGRDIDEHNVYNKVTLISYVYNSTVVKHFLILAI